MSTKDDRLTVDDLPALRDVPTPSADVPTARIRPPVAKAEERDERPALRATASGRYAIIHGRKKVR